MRQKAARVGAADGAVLRIEDVDRLLERELLILNEELWHTSGHWDHYQENMYFTKINRTDYAIKPMNCPGAMLAYKRHMYSYRDLPIRLCEMGQVHRHELSGALHGLMRVRTFTQDDAHIFMLPELWTLFVSIG